MLHTADGEALTKQACEMNWWNTKFEAENGTLKNTHYKMLYTEFFAVSPDVYAGMKVLDLGCGPRGSLEWMIEAKTRVCLDPLADKYGRLGANTHDMVYVRSGVESMPLLDSSFDVVTSINNFDHVSNPMEGLLEIQRVLKPGGTMRMIVELHAVPTACEPQAFTLELLRSMFRLAKLNVVSESATEAGHRTAVECS